MIHVVGISSFPDIVIIQLGTNDAKNAQWDSELFCENLAELVGVFQGLETRPDVFLCIPPPLYADGFHGSNATLINTVDLETPTPDVELVPSVRNMLLWKTFKTARATTFVFTAIDKGSIEIAPLFRVDLEIRKPRKTTYAVCNAERMVKQRVHDPPLMFLHGTNTTQRIKMGLAEYKRELEHFETELDEGSTLWWLPGYQGHMNYDITVPHIDALKSALWFNPNNCALEASPTTTLHEMDFIAQLAREIAGWNVDWRDQGTEAEPVDPNSAWGYVCVGGTIATLMGLWVARNKMLDPEAPRPTVLSGGPPNGFVTDKIVLCNEHSHYSIAKACNMLGIRHELCRSDANDRMILPDDLSNVLAVVPTIGSTEAGVVDDLASIINRCRQAGVWVHADAAYGGYFKYAQADLEDEVTRNAFASLGEADSITIDPHKCGYAPYPTAVFMLRRKTNTKYVDCAGGAPYIHGKLISSYTVEGSRSGALIAAEYFAHKVMQPSYEPLMQDVLKGAAALKRELRNSPERFEVYPHTDLGMVIFKVKPEKNMQQYMSLLGDYKNMHNGACRGLTVASTEYKTATNERDPMFRIVVMDPSFKDYVGKFVRDLKKALKDIDKGKKATVGRFFSSSAGISGRVPAVGGAKTQEELDEVLEALGEPSTLWKTMIGLTQIPRASGRTHEVFKMLTKWAEDHGLQWKSDGTDNHSNLLITKGSVGEAYRNSPVVIVQGHMDMVTVHNQDRPDYQPLTDKIQPFVEDGFLRAYGTTLGADDGMGVAMILALLESTTIEHPPLAALFTFDEETSMAGASQVAQNAGRLLPAGAKYFVNVDSEAEGCLFLGGAGGKTLKYTTTVQRTALADTEAVVEFRLSGLRGGHSGIKIGEGRANALQTIARVILQACRDVPEARLISLNGGLENTNGPVTNAITAEARARVAVPRAVLDQVAREATAEMGRWRQEYKNVEVVSDVVFAATTDQGQLQRDAALRVEDSRRILAFWVIAPNGPLRMSPDPETAGMVETSCAHLYCKLEPGQSDVLIMGSERSNRNSQWVAVDQVVTCLAQQCGLSVELSNYFPVWEPQPQSDLAKAARQAFVEVAGRAPKDVIVHAGLECGIISSGLQGLQMVSIGPQIDNAHDPKEQCLISSVQPTFKWLCRLLQHLKD
eukprot:m51a1_g7306 hypothetical protein (1155) ;mRNA; f:101137-107065